MKHNKPLLKTLILSLLMVACNGGGGGGSGTGNGGNGSGGTGGGNGSGSTTSTITKLQVLSSSLNSQYSNTCIYSYGNITNIINGDGSGNGYAINISHGSINAVSNLPKINSATDVCLDNFNQLTWYSNSDRTTVNIVDPNDGTNNTVHSINLQFSGVTGSDVTGAAFDLVSNSELIANSTFQLGSNFGFSILQMNNYVPSGLFSGIDNSQYLRSTSTKPAYGFSGLGSTITQYLNTDGTSPSLLINYLVTSSNSGQTTVREITDANGNAIPQMSASWDFASTGKGIAVVSGLVQPEVYNCPAKTTTGSSFNYVCDSPIVNTDLLKKYKMMRVLGANNNILYFMGMDLANQQIAIFSMSI